MSTQPDGGPAFPCPHLRDPNATGISTRDYFAAEVAAALIVREGYHQETTTNEGTALKSFRMADAMLAARERKSP